MAGGRGHGAGVVEAGLASRGRKPAKLLLANGALCGSFAPFKPKKIKPSLTRSQRPTP